jgi:hypothetical protein
MTCPVVEIQKVIRPLRGDSLAHMVRGQDGRCYVAKFAGTPQRNRLLINEWIGWRYLQRLDVATPNLQVLRLRERAKYPEGMLKVPVPTEQMNVGGSLHLGSCCPVDPETSAIWDFLPKTLLSTTVNLEDFAKVLVIDRLLGLSGKRQAIFSREVCPGQASRYRAFFVDHGMLFGGSRWNINEDFESGLYWDRRVYGMIDLPFLWCQAANALSSATDMDFLEEVSELPDSWFDGTDKHALVQLTRLVRSRKQRLHSLISESLRGT